MELLRRLLRWLNGRPDKVMYIGGSDTLPPPLPRQEEARGAAGPSDPHRAKPAAGGVHRPPV